MDVIFTSEQMGQIVSALDTKIQANSSAISNKHLYLHTITSSMFIFKVLSESATAFTPATFVANLNKIVSAKGSYVGQNSIKYATRINSIVLTNGDSDKITIDYESLTLNLNDNSFDTDSETDNNEMADVVVQL